MYFCSRCDGENKKDADYCIHCGAKILSEDEYNGKKEEIRGDMAGMKFVWFVILLFPLIVFAASI